MRENEVRYYRAEKRGLEIVHLRGARVDYPEHSHVSTYAASFVVGGTLRLETRRAISFHGEDSFFAIPPYEPHALSSSGDCEIVTLCIGGDLPRAFFSGEKTVLELVRSLPDTLPLSPDAFPAGFVGMLDRFFATTKEPLRRKGPFVVALERTLRLHPEEPFDLEAFAEEQNVSRFHLLREFKKGVGLPPHKFQIQNRVRKARKMILDARVPLTEVALAVGFYDQSHFIRCFKRFAGMTPSEYRNACVLEGASAERGEELGEE